MGKTSNLHKVVLGELEILHFFVTNRDNLHEISDFHVRYQSLIRKRRAMEKLGILSQFLHFAFFMVEKPKMQLDCGTLITSVDIDVGCKRLGIVNSGKNDINVHYFLTEKLVGQIEERLIPKIVKFFDTLTIPITFAVRGQLFSVENSVLKLILDSPIEHDIGAHGYYHKTFTSMSENEAQNELELISDSMAKFGIKPISFVFPRNQIAHLCLLERFGYKCYRDRGGIGKDGMYIQRNGKLYDIHPSFYLGIAHNSIFLYRMIDIAIKRRLPFHVWFHPSNLHSSDISAEKILQNVYLPLYKYAKKKADEGLLKFETMGSIVKKMD